MTILQATAEVNNLAAQVNAFDMYNKGMDDVRIITYNVVVGYCKLKELEIVVFYVPSPG